MTGRWFSPGTLVSSTNKTDCHDITEIFFKVALNTINQNQPAILLLHIDWTILEGVITLFHLEYFIRKLQSQFLLHFRREFLKTLFACLLSYADWDIIYGYLITSFVKELLPLLTWNILNGRNSLKLKLCMLTYAWELAYLNFLI